MKSYKLLFLLFTLVLSSNAFADSGKLRVSLGPTYMAGLNTSRYSQQGVIFHTGAAISLDALYRFHTNFRTGPAIFVGASIPSSIYPTEFFGLHWLMQYRSMKHQFSPLVNFGPGLGLERSTPLFSVIASAGIDYRLSKQFSISIEPVRFLYIHSQFISWFPRVALSVSM